MRNRTARCRSMDFLQGVHFVEQRLALGDELLGLLIVEGFAVECRIFQQGNHLRCQGITLAADRTELIFETGIGGVIGRAATL